MYMSNEVILKLAGVDREKEYKFSSPPKRSANRTELLLQSSMFVANEQGDNQDIGVLFFRLVRRSNHPVSSTDYPS